jgi:hypothetical protein
MTNYDRWIVMSAAGLWLSWNVFWYIMFLHTRVEHRLQYLAVSQKFDPEQLDQAGA